MTEEEGCIQVQYTEVSHGSYTVYHMSKLTRTTQHTNNPYAYQLTNLKLIHHTVVWHGRHASSLPLRTSAYLKWQ